LPQEKAVPTRLVRADQAKKAAAVAADPTGTSSAASSSAQGVAEAPVDAYEFLEATAVLSKVS
jgi:hypothetical protein